MAKIASRRVRHEPLPQIDGGFGSIYIDPPWDFKTYSKKGWGKSPQRHYPCHSVHDLAKIPVESVAAKNCIMHMWVIQALLPEGLWLMQQYGFKYKTYGAVWVKTTKKGKKHFGPGYWYRSNPELCLVGVRGKPKRINKGIPLLLESEVREHSRKPDEMYDRIERLTAGPYLEMFSRNEEREGWSFWGNEVGKFGGLK